MEIRTIEDKEIWQSFLLKTKGCFLLQSWQWGDFAQGLGRKIFRLGLFKDDELIGMGQFVEIRSKRGDYIETHGGPVFKDKLGDRYFEYFILFHNYLLSFAKKEKIHFIRFRLPMFHDEVILQDYLKIGYIKAPMYFQAEHTLILDLTQNKEELLKQMRKNTRYYIRKAEKNNLEIEFTRNKDKINDFYRLYQNTVERHDFVAYDLEYLKKEFNAFVDDGMADLVFVRQDGKDISAAIISYFGDTAYYRHAGSIRVDPDVYASYLLQWEIIKYLKAKNIKQYDFFGVAPHDHLGHPRSGLTLFKRGFGGERVRYMHTVDYPVNRLRYWLVYAFVKYERWRRKL